MKVEDNYQQLIFKIGGETSVDHVVLPDKSAQVCVRFPGQYANRVTIFAQDEAAAIALVAALEGVRHA